MKRLFENAWFKYVLILGGLGLLIVAVMALLGPLTGNIFSNVYSNLDRRYASTSAANRAIPPATAKPVNQAAPPITVNATRLAASSGMRASPYRANRLIIKNAELSLLATDVDRVVGQITAIAVGGGGYVLGERTWQQDDLTYAVITIGVPSDQYEIVQRQVRALGARVLSAASSGQDVSDEYVDLEARQRNLEATAARIREFLSQTTDTEQALLVNAKLSEVEKEIEQIKGRLAYLQDRSAYSTMTINLEPVKPTLTPTLTPTATETPEPTPTATSVAWQPEKTFDSATGALGSVLQKLGDVAIWLIAFVAPLVIPVAFIAGGAFWIKRRRAKQVVRNPYFQMRVRASRQFFASKKARPPHATSPSP